MFSLLVIVTLFITTNGLSVQKDGVLITKYAKVSRFGTNHTAQENSRNQRVQQSIWTPRSSASSNSKNQVVRQYPVYKNEEESDKVPGIGEVIQDRFQVRPYFGYGKIKDEYSAPATQNIPAPARQAPPIPPLAPSPPISPPALPAIMRPAPFSVPQISTNPPPVPSNLYDSPYTSYNPPPSQTSDSVQDDFPPNSPPSDSGDSNKDSYADVPISDDGPYNYQPAPKPSSTTTKPADMPPKPEYHMHSDDGYYSGGSPMHSHSHDDNGPPKHPPKSIDDVYYPPDFPTDQIEDHKPNGMDMAPADMAPMSKPDGDMTADLVPPVHTHDFPKYLYDSHHYDHHVYEEIPHTSTTPAPEKKRVSTTNYSYYYLGRKLWYIPLYFSIYFMIYVTALIIKSIARHKVTFRNDWITANSRKTRDLSVEHMDTIDEIHRNINNALDKTEKMYSM